MNRVVAALVTAVVSLSGGLSIGFLLSPDPTGMTSFLIAPVIALIPAPFLYRDLRAE